MIDVRDAAEFAVLCATNSLPGIWNVTGKPLPFSDVMEAISKASESDAEFIWVDESKIAEAKVMPWVDIPMMAPLLPSFRYFLEVSTDKARSAGLTCRSIEDILEPLLIWDRSQRTVDLKGGMTIEQETSLLGRQTSS